MNLNREGVRSGIFFSICVYIDREREMAVDEKAILPEKGLGCRG